MSAQHTPGPWWVRTRTGHDGKIVDCFVAAHDVNGFAYDAEIMGDDEYGDDIDRKLADANLIASAPDLVLERDAWFNQAAELLTERDALKARVAELEKDAARLDFVQCNALSLYTCTHQERHARTDGSGGYDTVPVFDGWAAGMTGEEHPTPRAAIDAAMTASKEAL